MLSRRIFVSQIALFALCCCAVGAPRESEPSKEAFWAKFRAAVMKGDKESVAAMTQFPIEMPYGQAMIKTRAELLKRYRDVFIGEANAAKCFAGAKPEIDPAKPKRFTIGCDNGSGEKVVVYGFVLSGAGWKLKSLDNINE